MINSSKRPFIIAGYGGILLILLSLALMSSYPLKAGKLPDGFFSPVIAFEFIRTESEVYDLFGRSASAEQAELAGRMEKGTYLDFVFIAVYSAFLLIFADLCRRVTGSGWFLFSMLIVIPVFISDFCENRQLLAIVARLNSGGFDRELELLNFFTWAKWGGLSALFISLIPFLRKSGIFGRIISVTALFSALAGSAAFFNRSVLNEIFVIGIELVFAMLVIYSFTYRAADHSE